MSESCAGRGAICIALSAVVLLLSLITPNYIRALQTPTLSASPEITTATCGKPVCTWKAFGPKTYVRPLPKPDKNSRNEEDGDGGLSVFSDSFNIQNIATQYTLHISADERIRAEIFLNGKRVLDEDDFEEHHRRNEDRGCRETDTNKENCKGPEIITIDKAIHPLPSNVLEVRLHGKPAMPVSVSVIGIDNSPPSILETIAPLPNHFGWINTDVQIRFACSDATSGIASCPNTFLLATEGLNQLVSGTAFDLASNSATSRLQVSIDKTPPAIAASQNPAPNSAGWNNSAVTVNFSCADNLSGMASCASPVAVSSEGANQQVSGTASDKAGNSASTSISLNIDETPPVISINTPANATTLTAASLQVTGAVSDNLSGVASVVCDRSMAVISVGAYACNVSLAAGINTIQVQATDNAGNIAATQITVTFNATPPPPPKSILITPSTVNMLVGDTRPLKLVGDIGQAVIGATWSINDLNIVSISSIDPPQLTALAQGITTLTATFNGLTATMRINVLPGTALPAGTVLWAFDPLPGNTITQMVPGNPVNPGDPDIFAVEAPNTLRAFTKDGLQLWAVSVGVSSAPAATLALPSTIQQPQSVINPFDPTPTLASIPAAVQDMLRKHGAFDSLDLTLRQQRLIERQRHRASPRNASGTTMSTALLSPVLIPSNAAASDLTTLLIKAVPDNSGGVINLVETFTGCCSLIQTSIIKIDTARQQQVWRHDFTGMVDENFAIGADSTVYSSQVISSGTAGIFGSPTTSLIFALDGATGQQKFSLPLPPGHFRLADTEGIGSNSTVITLADLDVAAQPGPLSILPDGSINAVVSTNHLEEDFQRLFSGGGSETAVSDHKTLQLLTIQPDSSFTYQSIQAFDFDRSACQGSCNDPGAGYIPNEVVPDGVGGLIATWTGNDAQLGITTSSAALARHFDGVGRTLDYVVPFARFSWFALGANSNPQSLVVGENNTAFGSDGQSVIAFDVSTGAQLWNFQPPGFQGTALLAATAPGGIAAVQLADFQGTFDATPNALLAFDSTGVVSSTPLAANNSNITYFDTNTILGLDASGQGEMLMAEAAFDPNAEWLAQGNTFLQRASRRPQIVSLSPSRALIGSVINVQIQGAQLSKIVSVDAGPGTTVTINPKNRSNSQMTITLTMDAPTVLPGVHPIVATLKNGLNIQSKQPFFVQVPAQLRFLKAVVSSINATANGCPAVNIGLEGPFGIKIAVRYQVLDQDSPAKSINATMPLLEDLTNFVVDGQPQDDQGFGVPVTGSGNTEADGSFLDQPIGACGQNEPFGLASFTQRLFTPLSPTLSPTVRTTTFFLTGQKGCGLMTDGSEIKVEVKCR